jgi:hypothetical protein
MEKETFNAPEAEIIRFDEEALTSDFNIGVSGSMDQGSED